MFLGVNGYRFAQAATGLTAVSAVVMSTAANAAPGNTGLAVAAAGLLSLAADPIATWVRHGDDVRYLDWKKPGGRGWHIPIVATGLALTFGGESHTEPAVDLVKRLSTMPGEVPGVSNDIFARLFVGIQPMAFVVGAVETHKSGWKQGLKTLFSETLANAVGSGLATLVGIPLYENLVASIFGKLTSYARGLADLAHYIFPGYYTVLRAQGWADSKENAKPEVKEGRARQRI